VSEGRHTALLLTFARRGEEEAIREAIAVLREAMPGGSVEAIGTPASTPLLRACGVDEIIPYGEGAAAFDVIRRVRARRFGAALVLYSGPRLSGHLKLETVALAVGADRTYGMTAGEAARQISRTRVTWSVAAKMAQAALRVLAAAALCAVAFSCLRLTQMLAGRRRAGRD
jgi:hypothetical protein